MKFVLLFLLVTMIGCSRVGTGEVGVLLSWDKQLQSDPVVNSIEVHVLDTLFIIDSTQVRVPIQNIKAKDSDGILFQDIDAQITFNVTPQGAVDFYRLTKEIEYVDGESVVGARVIEKEAKNALVKTFTLFKANQVNTDKSSVEQKLLQLLTEELERRYPKTFVIVDVNIDSAQLDPNVEKVLQSQALIDSEKRIMESKAELQIKQSSLLDEEISQMKATANKTGISLVELMKYKNEKERNKVLSEMAKNNGNTQIQVKE
jgi:hypothetical protein